MYAKYWAPELAVVVFLLRSFITPVIIAFIITAPLAAFVMQKLLESMAYHTQLSAWIFIVAGASTVIISIVTVGFHSLRAARANPVSALQSE